MRYPDLSLYEHRPEYRRPELLNFGWLNVEDDIMGKPDEDVANRLRAYLSCRVAQARGLHFCPFCPRPKNDGMFVDRPTHQEEVGWLLGSAEIRVFGPTGELFAAPDLVVHYVARHGYRVPESVARALRAGPQPGSEEYRRVLATVIPAPASSGL